MTSIGDGFLSGCSSLISLDCANDYIVTKLNPSHVKICEKTKITIRKIKEKYKECVSLILWLPSFENELVFEGGIEYIKMKNNYIGIMNK